MEESLTCPLCDRSLGSNWNRHHMKPRKFGGKGTVKMHKICHTKIHLVFTEKQLFEYYHTPKRLMENRDIRRFVKWIKKKDPDYTGKNLTKRKLRKRRT